MLVRLFRTNQPIMLLGLPVVAILFWWVYFVKGDVKAGTSLFGILEIPVWTLIVVQFLLSILEAIIFNRILNDLELFEKQSYVPALCYVVLSAVLIPQGQLQVTSLPNFFLLQAVHSLLVTYRQNSAKQESFLSGFLLGVCALIWWPFVILLVFAIISLNLLKSFNWRETMLLAGGFLWPGFLFSSLYFGINGKWYFPHFNFIGSGFSLDFGLENYDLNTKLFGACLFILICAGSWLFISRLQGTILKVKKQRMIWMWLSLFMTLLAILHPAFNVNGFPLLILPASFFISFLMVHTSFQKVFLAFFYLMLIFFFFHHFPIH